MGAHAGLHRKAGYPLPVPWAGIMETHQSHKTKTHKSLLKPFWQGAWRIEDGGHKAVLNCGGIDGVVLELFGVEDTQAIDRARGEWACGWIDEAAPTLEGGGVDELVYDVLSTSLRVPNHAKAKLITENFPEESHWSWERFKPRVGGASMFGAWRECGDGSLSQDCAYWRPFQAVEMVEGKKAKSLRVSMILADAVVGD
jgi:hypothetical protein